VGRRNLLQGLSEHRGMGGVLSGRRRFELPQQIFGIERVTLRVLTRIMKPRLCAGGLYCPEILP
jgi:hypothetical protein